MAVAESKSRAAQTQRQRHGSALSIINIGPSGASIAARPTTQRLYATWTQKNYQKMPDTPGDPGS